MTGLHVGVGLWNMRATARRPAAAPALYRGAVDDAVAAERHGFDSLWFGEHRFWYDGWCPQPLHVATAAAAATTRLHLGTAMYLLPQHDPAGTVDTLRTATALVGDRLELGVSLGYRPEEYAGMGLGMDHRVGLMNRALDQLAGAGLTGRVWVGGMAEAAVRRAGRRGLSLMLPPTIDVKKVRSLVAAARDEAAAHGTTVPRVGILKDVWVDTAAPAAREYYLPRLTQHYAEYVTAWWARGADGTIDLGRVGPQVRRNVAAALVGRPAEVAERLAELVDAGVDTLVLQYATEETRSRGAEQMAALADGLLPILRPRPGAPVKAGG
ncbi:MAG TPA: LLM class flavin-dependent oxidoreductase [Acidimicrobiales bacterium]|nr:LLM class flavin-dependent oxidoreductase [Acidimicrobiales bacterium]